MFGGSDLGGSQPPAKQQQSSPFGGGGGGGGQASPFGGLSPFGDGGGGPSPFGTGGGGAQAGGPSPFGTGGTNNQYDMEDPDVPEEGEQYDPKDLARMHFLIIAGQLMRKFHKAFPTCPTTSLAKGMFDKNFPRIAPKIDKDQHREMTYPITAKQIQQADQLLKQFHDCMHSKITMNRGQPNQMEVQASEFFKNRDKRAWIIISQKIPMMRMLGIDKKMSIMTPQNQQRCWRFVDLLYAETKKFAACKHLESMIPQEMKQKLEAAMSKQGGPSPDSPMGMSAEDVKTFMTSMDPNMMGNFISNVFSKPEMLQQTMASVGDLNGGNAFSEVTDMMANIFKAPTGPTGPPGQ